MQRYIFLSNYEWSCYNANCENINIYENVRKRCNKAIYNSKNLCTFAPHKIMYKKIWTDENF